MFKKTPTQLIYVLMSNLFVFIITILGLVLSDIKQIDVHILFYICIFVVAGLSLFLFVIYLSTSVNELKIISQDIRNNNKQLSSLSAISNYVIFESRTDIFEIGTDGNGELTWRFKIIRNTQQVVNEVNMPIFAEHLRGRTAQKKAVEIIEVLIDGEKPNPMDIYIPQFIRMPIHSNTKEVRSVELGNIRIPVNMTGSKTSVSVKIKMLLNGVFNEALKGEFALIDFPYLTEHFLLKLSSKSPDYIVIPFDDQTSKTVIEALRDNNENVDVDEMLIQAENWKYLDGQMIWETRYPKLGYNYRVKFRLVKKEA